MGIERDFIRDIHTGMHSEKYQNRLVNFLQRR
jgi:hypothetical protein